MIIGAILSFAIYHTLLCGKHSRLARQITVVLALMIISYTPFLYFRSLDVQNAAVRFPFILSTFLYVLRVLEGMSNGYTNFPIESL